MTTTNPTPHLLDPDEATRLKRNNLCAACYGELIVRYLPKERKSQVTCSTEGCSCPGFVSRKFVDRAEAESHAEAAEFRAHLAGTLPWMPKQSQEELIESLGF